MATRKITIKRDDGKIVESKGSPWTCIRVFCTECMKYDTDPKHCKNGLCPLYPWRGQSYIGLKRGQFDDD